jgi:hypothetical protein
MRALRPVRTRGPILLTCGLSLLISLSVSSAAHAWGRIGHRVTRGQNQCLSPFDGSDQKRPAVPLAAPAVLCCASMRC